MKNITIENIVVLYYPEIGLSYAQIINTVVNYTTKEDLRYGLKVLKKETDAHKFFEWGFRKGCFWLKQRNGYKSPEFLDNRTLTVTFND